MSEKRLHRLLDSRFSGLPVQLGRLLDNVELILASELIAVRQAVELGAVVLPPALRPLDDVATVVPFVDRDRSLAPDVEVARAWLRERLAELG